VYLALPLPLIQLVETQFNSTETARVTGGGRHHRRLSELPEAPRSHVVAHAGVRMPHTHAHHAAGGGGGASGLRGGTAVVGSPPKTPLPRRSTELPNRRGAGLSPSARPSSLEVSSRNQSGPLGPLAPEVRV